MSKVGSKFRKAKAEEDSSQEEYVLPTEPTKPVTDLGQTTILIHGEKKIGKTSLVSKFPGAFFIMLEPGNEGLSIYVAHPKTWLEFKAIAKSLRKDKRFKTIVIDVVEKLYKLCVAYVCKREGCGDTPPSNDYGATWALINKEFQSELDRLSMTKGKGVVYLSHSTEKDFQTRDGDQYTKIVPNMPKGCADYVCGFVSIMIYYGYYGTERYLTLLGSQHLEGGQRIGQRFRTTKGKRVHSVPAGDDEQEAYENLLAAWGNQQELTGKPKATTQLRDLPAKRKKDR